MRRERAENTQLLLWSKKKSYGDKPTNTQTHTTHFILGNLLSMSISEWANPLIKTLECADQLYKKVKVQQPQNCVTNVVELTSLVYVQ